ncbi:MAG: DUF1244 domain-containing protein [Pseudomonadales bacterium]|nr:DUF1244 domain-containing protein [Pseudomonadales bacterium]
MTEKLKAGDNTNIEAAVFRHLISHLDEHKDVQNIELMNLADFCRNCLAKWYVAEAKEQGEEVEYEAARELVYGMPYSEWKDLYQKPATAEQMAVFEAKQKK